MERAGILGAPEPRAAPPGAPRGPRGLGCGQGRRGPGGTLQGLTGTGAVVKDRSPGLSGGLDMGTRERKERKATRCPRREWARPGWGGSRCGAAVALGGHVS